MKKIAYISILPLIPSGLYGQQFPFYNQALKNYFEFQSEMTKFEAENAEEFLQQIPAKLSQILTTLISTALKFTFAGKIEIECRLVDGKVEFKDSDTGRGIPKELCN